MGYCQITWSPGLVPWGVLQLLMGLLCDLQEDLVASEGDCRRVQVPLSLMYKEAFLVVEAVWTLTALQALSYHDRRSRFGLGVFSR